MSSLPNDLYLNDDFLDWETRDDSIPLWKHMIAGNHTPLTAIFKVHAPALSNTAACSQWTPLRYSIFFKLFLDAHAGELK